MRLGTAGHAATFEPHRLVVYRAGTFVDKKGKTREHGDRKDGEAWEQFKDAQAPDAVICNEREYAIALAIAAALRRADAERVDPTTGEPLPLLFGPGVIHEQRILWERRGRACSSTPDARNPGQWIADLKCLRSAEPGRFERAANSSGYRSQLTFYAEADAWELGLEAPQADLYSVVVEPFEPYVVTTFRLDAMAIDTGRRQIDQWWSVLENCEATDHWPGYAQSVATLTADDPDGTFGIFGGLVDDDPNEPAATATADEWSTP